jgi:hypothetical protein
MNGNWFFRNDAIATVLSPRVSGKRTDDIKVEKVRME